MNITAIGINHKTAPIEIREKFYLTPIQQDLLLSELKGLPQIIEAFVVSTCNRTEVYVHAINGITPEFVVRLITGIKSLPFQQNLLRHFYYYESTEALRHLFRVTCGLDSLVLGEKQILGQIKSSLHRAAEKSFFLQPFNILANVTIRTGKKARRETEIGFGGSSISWAAIRQAEQRLGALEHVSTLIIGAGKMSKLAVGQMVNRGFKELYLMNRTHELAQKLADQFNATAIPFCDIKEILSEVDLCICSSGAPHHILDHETVSKIMPERRGRHLLFMDISMPRNIDPKVAHIEDVTLFSIDDLDSAVKETMQKRRNAVLQVEKIIEDKLNEYYRKLEKLDMKEFSEDLHKTER